MLKEVCISKSFTNKIVFSDYYPNRDKFFTLFLHYYEDTPLVYDTLGEIMELILSFLKTHHKINTHELIEFMNDLNWISAGKLNKLPLVNQGISLGLLIAEDNNIRFVRYGRILASSILGNNLDYVGPEWDNFKIKSISDLSLLGLQSEDNYPILHEIELNNKERFVILETDAQESFIKSLQENVEYENPSYIYQVIECNRKTKKKRKFKS